eukprot:CAMPEP_0197034608 /NCGR_PEP_ID=MMETSP1384-20130603/12672_1 /TAXON_ID=29189 /ORGANISM="Ammonia sp." /LENGTH=223 /DNA_ID=CAMNT_0042464557 /DNA_START=113 /DNA_END=784 /DNA_ORIENTATION=-
MLVRGYLIVSNGVYQEMHRHLAEIDQRFEMFVEVRVPLPFICLLSGLLMVVVIVVVHRFTLRDQLSVPLECFVSQFMVTHALKQQFHGIQLQGLQLLVLQDLAHVHHHKVAVQYLGNDRIENRQRGWIIPLDLKEHRVECIHVVQRQYFALTHLHQIGHHIFFRREPNIDDAFKLQFGASAVCPLFDKLERVDGDRVVDLNRAFYLIPAVGIVVVAGILIGVH